MLPVTFSNLRALREKTGLKQVELAELAGVRQATLSEWERGEVVRVDLSVLDALCEVLSERLGKRVTLDSLRKEPKQ